MHQRKNKHNQSKEEKPQCPSKPPKKPKRIHSPPYLPIPTPLPSLIPFPNHQLPPNQRIPCKSTYSSQSTNHKSHLPSLCNPRTLKTLTTNTHTTCKNITPSRKQPTPAPQRNPQNTSAYKNLPSSLAQPQATNHPDLSSPFIFFYMNNHRQQRFVPPIIRFTAQQSQ